MKQRNQGILLIICAGFFFSLMTFFIRISGDLPTMQKTFFRNAVAAIFAAITLLKSSEKFHIKKDSFLPLACRCLFGTAGVICNFYAIDKINLSDANMLNKLSPFFAIILSYFILKEKANKVEWGAVMVAFIGALFIIKPSFQMNSIYAFIGLLGGLGAGIAYTFVRKLGKQGERSSIIVFCFSLFSCLVTAPFLIFDYAPMTLTQLGFLLLAGLSATGGQFCITAAYTKAPAKDISVFDYAQIVFAALLGFFFLDQVPDIFSFLGYIIIIGSAIYKWWYLKKQAAKSSV